MSTQDEAGIAPEIVALERAALERWGRGDPAGFLEITEADVAYFDPFVPARIDSLDALTALYESLRGKVLLDSWHMVDPRVQVLGDAAVLTFRFESRAAGAEQRWNSTEVYRRTPRGWRIVQTHWSLAAAPAPDSGEDVA
jgi:hypothetical protein